MPYVSLHMNSLHLRCIFSFFFFFFSPSTKLPFIYYELFFLHLRRFSWYFPPFWYLVFYSFSSFLSSTGISTFSSDNFSTSQLIRSKISFFVRVLSRSFFFSYSIHFFRSFSKSRLVYCLEIISTPWRSLLVALYSTFLNLASTIMC